jgi:transcriptional regulator with XRE-family HTH domain
MKNALNKRIMLLKSERRLTEAQFCTKAGISTGTFSNIRLDKDVSGKTLESIIKAFNVNEDWLYTGKGEMYNKAVEEAPGDTPWRDEAYQSMKQENSRLWEMVNKFMNGEINFLLPASETAYRPTGT